MFVYGGVVEVEAAAEALDDDGLDDDALDDDGLDDEALVTGEG